MDSILRDTMFANALITRICHDLINSVGTAQLALEENEFEIAAKSLQQAVFKLEIFRTLFKTISKNEKAKSHIDNFINTHSLDCTIKDSIAPYGLILFLLQKMITKSKAVFENNSILLTNFFMMEDEVQILEGTQLEITSGNIFAYLAHLQCAQEYKLKIEKTEEKSWKITIQRK